LVQALQKKFKFFNRVEDKLMVFQVKLRTVLCPLLVLLTFLYFLFVSFVYFCPLYTQCTGHVLEHRLKVKTQVGKDFLRATWKESRGFLWATTGFSRLEGEQVRKDLFFYFSWGKTSNLSSCSHTESMLDELANLSPEIIYKIN
jgi:hypothetical protein